MIDEIARKLQETADILDKCAAELKQFNDTSSTQNDQILDTLDGIVDMSTDRIIN